MVTLILYSLKRYIDLWIGRAGRAGRGYDGRIILMAGDTWVEKFASGLLQARDMASCMRMLNEIKVQ